ncbi:hypothetical protein SynSYN20_00133 [Synechococcus sp. SYN20]|nr:hypothetical protein SynSYN20_00133 [Synechococcus sp. SYN20]
MPDCFLISAPLDDLLGIAVGCSVQKDGMFTPLLSWSGPCDHLNPLHSTPCAELRLQPPAVSAGST